MALQKGINMQTRKPHAVLEALFTHQEEPTKRSFLSRLLPWRTTKKSPTTIVLTQLLQSELLSYADTMQIRMLLEFLIRNGKKKGVKFVYPHAQTGKLEELLTDDASDLTKLQIDASITRETLDALLNSHSLPAEKIRIIDFFIAQQLLSDLNLTTNAQQKKLITLRWANLMRNFFKNEKSTAEISAALNSLDLHHPINEPKSLIEILEFFLQKLPALEELNLGEFLRSDTLLNYSSTGAFKGGIYGNMKNIYILGTSVKPHTVLTLMKHCPNAEIHLNGYDHISELTQLCENSGDLSQIKNIIALGNYGWTEGSYKIILRLTRALPNAHIKATKLLFFDSDNIELAEIVKLAKKGVSNELDFSQCCWPALLEEDYRFNHITHLNLSNTAIQYEDLSAILCKFPDLQQLNLNNCRKLSAEIPRADPRLFASLERIKRLDISENFWPTEIFRILLPHLSHLEELNIHPNNLPQFVNADVRMPHLTHLDCGELSFISINQLYTLDKNLVEKFTQKHRWLTKLTLSKVASEFKKKYVEDLENLSNKFPALNFVIISARCGFARRN